MSKISRAIHEIHHMNNIASRERWVNNIHPLIKLSLTIFYIGIVVSFPKYDIFGLAAMMVYLFVVFNIAEISFWDCMYRLRIVLPFVCLVGMTNPFFDKNPIDLGFVTVNAGVLSMLTLTMKGTFTVIASYLLIATTTIEKICYALRLIHVPSIMVTQILLMYRYITLLLEEVNRITQAYVLRAPKQKGIYFKVWGSLTGQLLLRSIDRANAVYDSMVLRGYKGDFQYIGEKTTFHKSDIIYFIFWMFLFILFRKIPVIYMLGNWVGGLLI